MKHFRVLYFVSLALVIRGSAAIADDQCFVCHQAMADEPSQLFERDIHHAKGITCADCHGGDASSDDQDKGMNPKAGFIGVPKGDAISVRCARCHSHSEVMKKYGSALPTGQLESLGESVHGVLANDGKERIVQCVTCHGAHGIVSVKNPLSPVYPLNVVKTCTKCHANAGYMKAYRPSLPIDQLEKYRTSVHGIRNAKGDPKTAECVSCHGSHEIRSAKDVRSSVYAVNIPATCGHCHSDASYMRQYGIPTDQYEKYSKSVHGIALLQRGDVSAPACNGCHGNHGAAPPGLETVSNVCGTCHALNAELFSASPHKKAFDDKKLPECETCHSNHLIVAATDTLLGVASGSVCSRCHTPTTSVKGYEVAKIMRRSMDSLEIAEGTAQALIAEAEQKGMEVSDPKYKLRDARQARLEARTMVHSFDEQRFLRIVNKGLGVAKQVEQEAGGAVHEYYFRRIGLGVSTLIITILALSLALYIKRIEKKQRSTRHP